MANITLGQLRDLWKNVSDWVTGVATHEPKVTLSGSNVPSKLAADGLESVVFKREGLLAAGTSETLFVRSGVRCELEALTGASSSSDFAFDILVYKADGTTEPLTIPAISGTQAGVRVRPELLQAYHDGENDFFKNSVFDTQNSRYALIMKRQAVFGNGVAIRVVNTSDGDYNVAIVGMVYVARS